MRDRNAYRRVALIALAAALLVISVGVKHPADIFDADGNYVPVVSRVALSAMPASQAEALADGVVSAEEYAEAFKLAAECVKAETGITTYAAEWSTSTQTWVLHAWAPERAGPGWNDGLLEAETVCMDEFVEHVSTVWVDQLVPPTRDGRAELRALHACADEAEDSVPANVMYSTEALRSALEEGSLGEQAGECAKRVQVSG